VSPLGETAEKVELLTLINKFWNSAASENAPTSTELLQLASEQDGTREGREKEEEKRKKEEDWAVYTELNKKGAGNTMNRG
jgi:immunoglobulin-binding protein 1